MPVDFRCPWGAGAGGAGSCQKTARHVHRHYWPARLTPPGEPRLGLRLRPAQMQVVISSDADSSQQVQRQKIWKHAKVQTANSYREEAQSLWGPTCTCAAVLRCQCGGCVVPCGALAAVCPSSQSQECSLKSPAMPVGLCLHPGPLVHFCKAGVAGTRVLGCCCGAGGLLQLRCSGLPNRQYHDAHM